MEAVLIWLILAGIVAILLVLAKVLQQKSTPKQSQEQEGRDNDTAEVVGGRPGPIQSRNLRARVAALRRARGAEPVEEEGEEEEMTTGPGEEMKVGKIGTKKLKRIQEKAEKKVLREQEEAMREDRKRREALQKEEREVELEKEKLKQKMEEEEEEKRKVEREQKELEEYLQLKEGFIVEEEGVDAEDEETHARGITDFINYIKKMKVVFMEDLAAEFNLKTQDAISRVQSLQESGALTGVVDDRGKFIFISDKELKAVADFIKQRGRVSIAELVSSSNRLVNLQPEVTT